MTFPNVSDAFWGWQNAIQFTVVAKSVVDYEAVQEPVQVVTFTGVLEPIPERELIIKPEGQRTWMWWRMYTEQTLRLDDQIVDPQGRQYRVMRKSDWRTNGGSHFEYQLTEGTDPPSP